jgi:hypothetical protein
MKSSINKINESFYMETECLLINYYYLKERETPIFEVYNKLDPERKLLAELKLNPQKRKYYFYPLPNTAWSSKALSELYKIIQKIDKGYRLLRFI